MHTETISEGFRKRHPLRVALIDGESIHVHRLSSALELLGHEVEAYQQASELLFQDSSANSSSNLLCPDVILADFRSIGRDRLDRLHELCNTGCRCLHIGLMTDHGMSEVDLMRVARFDARVFLKPIEVSEVSAWFKVVASRRKSGKSVNPAG